jgi:hypothetical protein
VGIQAEKLKIACPELFDLHGPVEARRTYGIREAKSTLRQGEK